MSSAKTFEDVASTLERLACIDFESLRETNGFEDTRRRAVRAARTLTQELESSLELSRRVAWQEASHVVAIRIALDLGLFDILQKHDAKHGVSVKQVAVEAGAHEELIARVLRHLAAWHTIREVGSNIYLATRKSNELREPKVFAGIDLWLNVTSLAHRNLPKYLREHGYKADGSNLDNMKDATGLPLFEFLPAHPAAAKAFSNHLSAFTDGRAKWIDVYPVKERLLQGAQTDGALLVDVGGNVGNNTEVFNQVYPEAPGRLIVQDLPAVIAEAEKNHTNSNIELQAYDFFTPQPIVGARAYLLAYVLHDWADDKAVEILLKLKEAMKPGYSKLLVVELVVATENAHPFTTALDLTIMSYVGAKERTEEAWRALFGKVGLTTTHIFTAAGSYECVIEVELV